MEGMPAGASCHRPCLPDALFVLRHGSINADPNAATPVPAALVLPPAVLVVLVVGPLPVVVIDAQFQFGLVFSAAFDMPAITFVVANDRSRSWGRAERRGTGHTEANIIFEIVCIVLLLQIEGVRTPHGSEKNPWFST
jgi:hypothetical protein